VKEFDGETYILERGIRADLSIIKGWKADEAGNLVFRKTARNFNQPMATAARSASPRSRRSCRSAASTPTHPPAEHLREADDPRRALRQEDRVPHRAAAGGLEKVGFTEKELTRRIEIYGNVAQVWSSYAGTSTDGSVNVRGINSFQLARQPDGRWLVHSILWQAEPLPAPPRDMEAR
jgi:hypothetical protein